MENEKDTSLTAITSGSKYFSNVRSPATSHTQTLSNPFRNLTNKVRANIFYKEVFLRLPCVRRLLLRLYHRASVIYCVVMMLHFLPMKNMNLPGRTSDCRTRHAGHCWRSRDELIRDVLLWIPTHDRAKAGRPARTYIQQLCENTGCCPEDLPMAMNDREEWRERVRDIRATSTI